MNKALVTGQRVKVERYGVVQKGVVTRLGRSLVFVRFDGAKRETWLHRESVQPIR